MSRKLGDMIAESLERIVKDPKRMPHLLTTGEWPAELATEIQALELNLILVGESQGGASGGWQDAYSVLRLTGFHAIPLPVAEGMLAARILSTADVQPGPGTYTVATQVSGEWTKRTTGFHFSGELSAVPWGRHADYVLCVVSVDGNTLVCVLPKALARVSHACNLAGEPRDSLSFNEARAVTAIAGGAEAHELFEFSALARLAQTAGSLAAALELSIDYACQRKQFGQSIAKFQAVQQQVALFGAEVAAVSCAVQAACAAADLGAAGFQIAAAKLRANRAIGVGTAIAHQVHGAVGLSQEYALHQLTRRLWSWRSEFGNDRYWSEKIGAIVTRVGADRFWNELTAADDRVQKRRN